MILSLQGCMDVEKTTAIKYLQKNAPYINISFEEHTDAIEEVKSLGMLKKIIQSF